MKFPASHDYRLTKIVCTLGPSCATKDQIQALAMAGMNIARINVSHGNRASHTEFLERVARASQDSGIPIATLLDTRGAEIRTGDVQEPIEITAGQEVLFVPTSQESTAKPGSIPIIFVGYDGFSKDVQETNRILIDNGELSFSITKIQENGQVLATAEQAGSIGSRRHINLPGADIDLPSITDKDWDDIRFAADTGVDFVALSFIRTAQEVEEVRAVIEQHKSTLQIITKVETQQAVQNIAEIIRVSDGIMVARGDLGAEVPFEHLPVIQNEIIFRCREAGKPVIVATHMLESMIEHPIPTRAEVTDVAHAAMQHTDATMLSGETAGGKHPTLAIQAMDKILRATETQQEKYTLEDIGTHNAEEEQAATLVRMAQEKKVQAILVEEAKSNYIRLLSKYRPHVPVYVCSSAETLQNSLLLAYGITPVAIQDDALETLLQKNLIHKGDVLLHITATGEKIVVA